MNRIDMGRLKFSRPAPERIEVTYDDVRAVLSERPEEIDVAAPLIEWLVHAVNAGIAKLHIVNAVDGRPLRSVSPRLYVEVFWGNVSLRLHGNEEVLEAGAKFANWYADSFHERHLRFAVTRENRPDGAAR